ncbi:MAG TPA: hypothetical protein VHN37_11070 [Actinomycetota bacterium]|nr:hypothetical protein [Actinomycetota bacterium]
MNLETDVKGALDAELAGLDTPHFHPRLVERVRKARVVRLGVNAIVVAAVAAVAAVIPWTWSSVNAPAPTEVPVAGAPVTAVPSPAVGSCETGPWATYCPEAAWARVVAVNADHEVQGDSGSALIIRAPGSSFYLWAFEPDDPSRRSQTLGEEGYELLMEVDGTPVYFDGTRLTWDAHGMWVWLEGGPERGATETARGVIAPIVEASLETPYP